LKKSSKKNFYLLMTVAGGAAEAQRNQKSFGVASSRQSDRLRAFR
jgi:hypothetical protein